MNADDKIIIQTGAAKIVMTSNGDITLSGKTINLKGSGNVVIKGSKVITNWLWIILNQNNPNASQASDETPSSLSPVTPGEVVIGAVVEFDEQGRPLVNFSENTSGHALPAITTLSLTQQHIGRQVALLFANEDMHSPK